MPIPNPIPDDPFKTKQLSNRYHQAYNNSMSLWKTEVESIQVPTSYGTTHVFAGGPEQGEPLVLLHGFGFSSTMWYPNIDEWTKVHRVYAVDVIGEFNRSRATKHFNKKEDYANWLSEVLDSLGLAKATFIGHSNGGWHVLNYTMHAQERVRRIVLLAPAASFARFSFQFPIRLLAANLFRTRAMIINFCGKWFVAKGNEVSELLFEQFYHGIKGFGWKHKIVIPSVFRDEDLMRIEVPCLMMIGDQEVIYNIKTVTARAKKLIPHIKTVLVPGAGHALSIERADIVNKHIAQFLNS